MYYVMGRIYMQPAKQAIIQTWKEPLKTAKEIRQFLGLASYYRNYIPNFATIAEPLIALTRKRSTIQWTWEVQQAFRNIKDIVAGHYCTASMGARSQDYELQRMRVGLDLELSLNNYMTTNGRLWRYGAGL